MDMMLVYADGEWMLKDKRGKVLLRGKRNESFHEFEKRCAEYKNSKKKDRHES